MHEEPEFSGPLAVQKIEGHRLQASGLGEKKPLADVGGPEIPAELDGVAFAFDREAADDHALPEAAVLPGKHRNRERVAPEFRADVPDHPSQRAQRARGEHPLKVHLPCGFRALTVLALAVLLLLEVIGDQEVHAVRAQVEADAVTGV